MAWLRLTLVCLVAGCGYSSRGSVTLGATGFVDTALSFFPGVHTLPVTAQPCDPATAGCTATCTFARVGACRTWQCSGEVVGPALQPATVSAGHVDVRRAGAADALAAFDLGPMGYVASGVPAAPLWAGGETIVVHADGGVAPKFTAEVVAASPVTFIPPPASGVSAGADLHLHWIAASGVSSDPLPSGELVFAINGACAMDLGVITPFLVSSTRTSAISGASCVFDAGQGDATVPAAVMAGFAGTPDYAVCVRQKTPVSAGAWGIEVATITPAIAGNGSLHIN